MADVNLTKEQREGIRTAAEGFAAEARRSGGRVGIQVSTNGIFEEIGYSPPELDLPPDLQREYEQTLNAITNASFDSGYRSADDVERAILDSVDYAVDAAEQAARSYEVLATSKDPQRRANAQATINQISTRNLGDIEDPNSPLAGYRKSGPSYFSGNKNLGDTTADERAVGALNLGENLVLDPEEFTVGKEIEAIAAQRREDALGGQPTRSGIPSASKTRPTRSGIPSASKTPMSPVEYQVALADAAGGRGGMSTEEYRAALEGEGARRASGGVINYAPIPTASAGQIAPLPTRGAINYNDNAPTATAARVGAVPEVGAFNYTNPIAQAQAAQARRTPDIDPGSINYAPIPYAKTSQISPDAMVDDRAIQMVQSKYEDPSYYGDLDPRGLEGMGESLDYLDELIANEGRDAVSEAYYNAKRRESETARRGHLQAAIQDLEARGMGTSGGELQAAIQGANATTRDLYDASMQAAALAQERKDKANNDRAVQAEAHRRVTFGEAATIEEALRDVSKARGMLEMERQVVNSETLRHQADLEQETRLANLKVKADELNARGRFAEEAAVRNQIAALETNLKNASLRNDTNIANMEAANREYRGRNRAMEEGVLQTQDLRAQRNAEQARLENAINERNAIIAGEDWNARNRALESFSEQEYEAATTRNRFQADMDTRTSIANATLGAGEVGEQNRFKEDEFQNYYDMIANAVVGDAASRAVTAGVNVGSAFDTYGGYTSSGNFADNFELEMQKLELLKQQQNPGAGEIGLGIGSAAAGGAARGLAGR